ncbi:MAG: hypothetical protein EOM20_19045 [Spartobacteria bacterium]|nr:hypothetical protein [Spartobacteria bacterium]
MKHCITLVLIAVFGMLCVSCEQVVKERPLPVADIPAAPPPAYNLLGKQDDVSFACEPRADRLDLRLGTPTDYARSYGPVDLYIGVRCPAVLSAPEQAPLSTEKHPDFRWAALSHNPLPTDHVNANPNTVIVLSLMPYGNGYRLATQRVFKAAGPAAPWREAPDNVPVRAELGADAWSFELPWDMVNAGARPAWFDISLVMLAVSNRDVVLTFPPENGQGPRSLISFVYSFPEAPEQKNLCVAVNTSHRDATGPVVDAYPGNPTHWMGLPGPEGGFVPGTLDVKDGLLLRAREQGCYAVYQPTPFGGNFSAVAEGGLLDGETFGWMLMKVGEDGAPKPGSFIRLMQTRNEKGQAVVRLVARDGEENKLEEWWQKHPPFFEYVLGNEEMGRKALGFRFLRDARTGCLRAGYKYSREVDGILLHGWMEFPTVADWDQRDWVAALFVCAAEDETAAARFPQVRVDITRRDDQDDRETGFAVRRRPYTFSGVEGDALVVTFDDAWMPRGEKFVFWSEANYIPWWHIDATCALSYEFVEVWGGGTTWKGSEPGGCCEPMSDRLLRWSTVNVVEANEARIMVRWVYVLANPEYQWWGLHDTLRPVVEEEYCFYPDGTGVRAVTYHPVAGTPYPTSWNELSEPMLIHRGGVMPSTCLDRTALSMLNLRGDRDDYTYLLDTPQHIRPDTKNWDEVIVRINLNHRPAVFGSFSQSPATRDQTFPGYYETWWGHYENGWHVERHGGYEYEEDFWPFAHWPISKIPYDDHTKSNSKYLREPGHTSILGIPGHPGAEAPVSWSMLFGLSPADDDNDVQARTLSWLYPGRISDVAGTCTYAGNDYARRALTFINQAAPPECSFTCSPESILVRPVIVIKEWGAHLPQIIQLDGAPLDPSRYRAALSDQHLILWIDHTFHAPFTLRIQSRQ